MKIKNKLKTLTIFCGIILPLNVFALEKNETIYSILEHNGTTTNSKVSNHLSFIDQAQIEDETELKNILNISGEETFNLNGNKLSWNTSKKDIYYEGETEKQLPIQTKITYYLNEEEKQASDILGQTGKITIKIIFENLEKQIVSLNQKQETMYTPFVTTIGTLLNSDHNKNITISNGHVVSTGKKNMLIGLAAPGLYESIGLEELKNLNEITITYETTKFELNNIYIVSTPKLLEEKDLTIFEKMDTLYSNVSELQKNMNTLENGIIELAKGIDSLELGSKELTTNLLTAKKGAENLSAGSTKVENGLKEIITSLKKAKEELQKNDTSSLTSIKTLINENDKARQAIILQTNLTEENLSATYEKLNLKMYHGDDPQMLALKSAYELAYLLKENNQALNKTTSTITALTTKLNNLLITLETALTQLEKGTNSLTSGINSIKIGIDKLYNGSTKLQGGINTLNTGAKTLKNGAQTFNKLGIGTLNQYAHTLKNYSDKIEILQDLSQNYNGFTSQNAKETIFISKVKSLKNTFKK